MVDEETRDTYVSTLILFDSLCSSSRSVSTSGTGGYVGEAYIEMKLDDEKNLDAEGNEGNTTFYAGDYVFILVLSSYDYDCYSTGDTLLKVGWNIEEDIVDNIVFAKASEATLSRPPSDTVSYEWVGRDPGVNPVFDGMDISLSGEATGLLRCEYKVSWDRWKVHHSRIATIITVAYIPDTEAITYLEINFLGDEAISGPQAWELMVLDYCNDDPVPGAEITLGGSVIGVTDENGIIFLGQLNPAEYTLKMTALDYIDSDLDKLHNDSIVIP